MTDDIAARSYDIKHQEIYNDIEQKRLDRILRELIGDLPPGAKALDFGSGTGNVTAKLLNLGCQVTAADVSRAALAFLRTKLGNHPALETILLTRNDLPFESGTFDIVVSYSVLHHIKDYLHAVRELTRVTALRGVIYIDHEANENAWAPNEALMEYRRLTRLTPAAHLLQLFRTGELFTFSFAKTVWMKCFCDRRYQREGDFHVWPDDHLEWNKIRAIFAEAGVTIIRETNYLCYHPRGGFETFEAHKDRCSDLKLLVGRKQT